VCLRETKTERQRDNASTRNTGGEREGMKNRERIPFKIFNVIIDLVQITTRSDAYQLLTIYDNITTVVHTYKYEDGVHTHLHIVLYA